MTTEPVHHDLEPAASHEVVRASLARRVARRVLHEAREAVLPTLFFFVGFNFIVLTSNLLVAHYLVAISNFMLATMAALVVGKAVLIANNLPIIRLFDRAPLIRPILIQDTGVLGNRVCRAVTGTICPFLGA